MVFRSNIVGPFVNNNEFTMKVDEATLKIYWRSAIEKKVREIESGLFANNN